jgi:dipeptidyl aminopeptidase/acylaminoacyl peptidase
MALNLAMLLDIRRYVALDLDSSGRVLAGSDDSGSMQLIEILPDGSVTRLTALPGACTGRYLPGQRAVIVSHDDGGNERHQLSVLPVPSPAGGLADLDSLQPLVRDERYIHLLADVTRGQICYFTNRRNGVAFDPVIRDLADGTERTLGLGDHMFGEAAISPDGRWLALTVFSAVTASAAHVVLVDLTVPAGAEHPVEVTPADAPAMNHALAWSPGSDALFFSSNNDREFVAVARHDLVSGQRTWLMSDQNADLTGWPAPDGSVILIERNDDGASVLALHDAGTGERLSDLPLPVRGSIGRIGPVWGPDSAALAMTVSGADVPSDVLLAVRQRGEPAARPPVDRRRGFSGGPALLTHSAARLDGEPTTSPEHHRVPARDGEQIPCLVYRPPAHLPGRDLSGSAVVHVHGGPESQARDDFQIEVQALAAAGHTVLVPNVRGSTGYGKRWYSADDGRRRLDSVADLAALHAYLPELGLDQARAALMGGSYGGYMVLAGLAFQPGLWAAGVDIVGIASLVTFLEHTSAYRRAYREREYGTLADDREFLYAASPLTRIDDITAPLFIIHGANDPRVPLSEAEQIHAGLLSRGLECELVVYADEGHGLAKRANRTDALQRASAFLARHLAAH